MISVCFIQDLNATVHHYLLTMMIWQHRDLIVSVEICTCSLMHRDDIIGFILLSFSVYLRVIRAWSNFLIVRMIRSVCCRGTDNYQWLALSWCWGCSCGFSLWGFWLLLLKVLWVHLMLQATVILIVVDNYLVVNLSPSYTSVQISSNIVWLCQLGTLRSKKTLLTH